METEGFISKKKKNHLLTTGITILLFSLVLGVFVDEILQCEPVGRMFLDISHSEF